MLKGVPAILSPQLMNVLMTMGHGDEIVLADGNFPSVSTNPGCVYISGHQMLPVLDAVTRFLPLDEAVEENVFLMDAPEGLKPEELWKRYEKVLRKNDAVFTRFTFIEKQKFYERAKKAYAVVSTGETTRFGNIILRKGIVRPDQLI